MEQENDDILKLADQLRWGLGEDIHDKLTESIYADAAEIASETVIKDGKREQTSFDTKLDRILTSKLWGFPIMLFMLGFVLWLTIVGSNVPSALLSDLFLGTIYPALKNLMTSIHAPWWLSGFLVDGVYLAVAWVISVMLPPMAIFFPMFTLLEDFGYLPRIAFNLDHLFKKAGAHGKQALTMSMGFGCNAAGVVATRIIDSPRERLIAIITNNFSLCNGRWPTQILLATIFVGAVVPSYLSGFASIGAVIGVAVLGIGFTFATSWALSKTLLRGQPSTFNLELPPYRPPQFWKTIYTSLIDRTLIVLWRAVVFAAPAGAIIWLISVIPMGSEPSIAAWLVHHLDNFGMLFGLNGVILLAYVVAIPANEIVIPTVLMLTVMVTGIQGYGEGSGVLFELDSDVQTGQLLRSAGWTLLTAGNLMLFSLLHNPCSTTIYTIYKETNSVKWTAVATILPIILGFVVTFLTTQIWWLIH